MFDTEVEICTVFGGKESIVVNTNTPLEWKYKTQIHVNASSPRRILSKIF